MGFWTQVYTSNFEKYFFFKFIFFWYFHLAHNNDHNTCSKDFFLSMDFLCGNSNPHALQLSVYQGEKQHFSTIRAQFIQKCDNFILIKP